MRDSKATEKLLVTNFLISKITADFGFDNIRTFNNVFKEIAGDVPKNIKK